MSGSGQVAGRHDAGIADLLRFHDVDPAHGLADSEAERKLAETGRNELPRQRRRPAWLRLLDQLREPMNLLLLAAALVSGVALGERLDAVAIAAIVVLNAVIALVQEGRADQALAALEQMSTPQATVLRGGVIKRISVNEVVPGDIVKLEAGDGIPADARLIESTLLEIDESLLTGESIPVSKAGRLAGSSDDDAIEDTDRLLWGTFVTRGSGTALVVSTGPATELGRIAASLDTPSPPTPLQVELGRLSSRLGVAAVLIAAAVFALTLVRLGMTVEALEQAFLSAVALAVAAVPEGLPAVTLVGLAVGVRRMARHRAIVRRLPAVETLGSASVIVTDKTGTITENRMTVTAAWWHGVAIDPDALPGPVAERGYRIAALANDATLESSTGDPMELALLRFAGAEKVASISAEKAKKGQPSVERASVTRAALTIPGSEFRAWSDSRRSIRSETIS
jgi:magnesium-transporting ATPase (P-type)